MMPGFDASATVERNATADGPEVGPASEDRALARARRSVALWSCVVSLQAICLAWALLRSVSLRPPASVPTIFNRGGLPTGSLIPDVAGLTPDGRRIEFRSHTAAHPFTAILFFSESCQPMCPKELASLRAACQEAGSNRLSALIVVPSRSEMPKQRDLPVGAAVAVDSTRRIEKAFVVAQRPHTVLVDNRGIVRMVQRGVAEQEGQSLLRRELLRHINQTMGQLRGKL